MTIQRWFYPIAALMFLATGCSRDPEVAKKKYLESGNRYFEKGKFNEASIMYRSALKKDPKYGEAYYRLGLTMLKVNNYQMAERSLRRSFELILGGPALEDTATKLSDIYLVAYMTDQRRDRAYEAAFTEFIKDLENKANQVQRKADKDTLDFNRLRLQAYKDWRGGDLDKALAGFEGARAKRAGDLNLELAYAQVAMAKGRFEEAERIIRDMIARDKTAGAAYDVLYREYAARNRPDDAEQIRRLKSENNPGNLDYRLQLAGHYFVVNKREESDRIVNAILADPKTFPRGRERCGDFYMNFREFDKAIATFRGGLGGSKEDKLNFQRKIADVLMLQGKNDQALQLLDKEILKNYPADPVALALRASLWLEMGNRSQLQQAISELETASSKLPRNAVVRYNLGRAYWAKGDIEPARAQFKSAVEMQPDYLAPRLALLQLQVSRGEFAQAIQASEEVLRLSPRNMTGRLLHSMVLEGVGKTADARSELQAILKAQPTSTEARFRLGLLEVRAGDYKTAEKVFRECSAQANPDAACQIGLAEVFSAQKQYDKAVELLNAELKKTPERRELRMAVANTNVLGERYDAAVAGFKDMIAKEPDSADLHLRLGETYRRMGNIPQAIETFRKVRQLSPNNPDAGLWLALLLHQTGREVDAKAEYEQILRVQSDNAIALNNLAYVIAEQGGDLDVALTYAQRAMAVAYARKEVPSQQRNPEIADTLGWIYIRKGLHKEALDIYRELVAKIPENPVFRYHYAMALFQQGNKPQAKKELETALRNKPPKNEEGKIRELLQKVG